MWSKFGLEESPARPTFPGRGCPVAPVLSGKQSAPAVIISTAKLLLVVEGTPQPMLKARRQSNLLPAGPAHLGDFFADLDFIPAQAEERAEFYIGHLTA
jgi:hypothetical protein